MKLKIIVESLPTQSPSGPALNPGGHILSLGDGVTATGGAASLGASITGLPGLPPHLYPPIVFSHRYLGHGGRGNRHSLISVLLISHYY